MIEIRLFQPEDLAVIAAIQTASPEASQWNVAEYECRVALLDCAIAGFLVVRQTAPDEREILNLAVDPRFRRRGIARELLRNALNESASVWFLEVRESNQAAIFLYKSLGFRVVGTRPGYYSNPVESGVVMKLGS